MAEIANYEETKQKIAQDLMDNADTMCVVFHARKQDETLYYRIVYVNETFTNLIGIPKSRLYAVDMTQEQLLQKVVFLVNWLNLDDVYNTKLSHQDTMYISKFDVYLRTNAFVINDEFICIEFVDVTEYEISKKKNERLLKENDTAKEEIAKKVELLEKVSGKLERSEKIYKLISETSNDGFIYRDYESGERLVSDKYRDLFRIYDVADSELLISFNDLVERELISIYYAKRECAVSARDEFFELETYVDYIGKWVNARTHLFYDEEGNVIEEITYYKDITDVNLQREKLEYWAYYDTLTGLYNRNYFSSHIDEMIKRAEQEGKNIYMLYIDVDDFKKINDSLGYKYGDELILNISKHLKKYISEYIRIARFNSDEFVMAIYDGDRKQVREVYKQLKDFFGRPILISNGIQEYITISVGVVEYPKDGKTTVDLIGNADIAMYQVKKNGKNGICYFEEKMLNAFLRNVRLESLLKKAVENQTFELYYQPQYDVKNNKLRGFEALIRWNDKTEGYISPGQFIPLAEKNGSIVEIGYWVLRQALQDYNEVFKKYKFDGILSINISAVQFKDQQFEEQVIKLFETFEITPSRIEFEITESIFLGESRRALELIERLRSKGIKISLDDFGTGYSSLSYLKNIAIDTLKIDKSFVDSMINEDTTNIITSGIVSMVQKLGLETIAEGVETDEQLEYLKEIECNNIQGYLTGKPMNIQDVITLLEKNG